MQSHTCKLSAFTLSTAMAFGAAALAADLPKQGTDSFTAVWVATSLNLIQQGNRTFASYEIDGVTRNDAGAPMFDSFGQRCIGFAELLDNEPQHGLGTCTFTDRVGDHIFGRYSSGKGNSKDGEHGTYELIGGSGKFAGITGSGEYFNPMLPIKADDKALRGVVPHKITWKLP
jgi:hypothetical protein